MFCDFNKIRMKLSELASMQIHSLFKKSQALEHSVMKELTHPDFFNNNNNRPSLPLQQQQQQQLQQQQKHSALNRQHITSLPPRITPHQPPLPPTNLQQTVNGAHLFFQHQQQQVHSNRFFQSQCQSHHHHFR